MPDAKTLDERAVVLLRELSGPHGIRASASATGNYQNVFARDAVMAGIAGMLLGDSTIIDGFVRTLERLRDLQGAEGQIASNYAVRDGQPVHVSFGTLVPRIDANTWYLIGIALGARAGVIDPAAYRDSVRAVVRLLDALEYNGRHLIYIPVGGNWADEYVYEGYVLYDQLLRVWALRLLSAAYGESRWEEKSALIAHVIDQAYWPEGRRLPHPVSAFSPTERRDTFDLAACSLLGMSGVTASRVDTTLEWIAERFTRQARLPPAFDPVIDETHPEWPALRRYQLLGFRNRPHEYHNGGIWPIWLGWLSLALVRHGRPDDLERLRELVARALDGAKDFQFQEYLHGVTGAPGGTPSMAYTATGLVFLRLAGSPAQAGVLGA
jgi:hypothetical protein